MAVQGKVREGSGDMSLKTNVLYRKETYLVGHHEHSGARTWQEHPTHRAFNVSADRSDLLSVLPQTESILPHVPSCRDQQGWSWLIGLELKIGCLFRDKCVPVAQVALPALPEVPASELSEAFPD